jgi:transcriptional regulator with XRE-family HTH domain
VAKKARSYMPVTRSAVSLLGTQIAQARRERTWTAADLAERLAVTPYTVARIERGEPTVAIGTVFEAASLVGVPLFSVAESELPQLVDAARQRLALLPARVAQPAVEIDDEF